MAASSQARAAARLSLRFLPTALAGCVLVESDPDEDERGAFARTFCAEEFRRHGLDARVAQCSVSSNREAGTLRGLHHQLAPYAEARLVSCGRGALFDVAVDLRPDSASFGRWAAWELRAGDHRAVYLPEGVAHGFVTLEADTDVRYQMSVPFRPEAAAGVRWDDADIGIGWPDVRPLIISERDRNLPTLAATLG